MSSSKEKVKLSYVRDLSRSISTVKGYKSAISLFNHFLVNVINKPEISRGFRDGTSKCRRGGYLAGLFYVDTAVVNALNQIAHSHAILVKENKELCNVDRSSLVIEVCVGMQEISSESSAYPLQVSA